MTFNQILKEFDECEHLETGVCDMNVAKSFLKQSFIKYFQSEVERWIKVFDYHCDMSDERHLTMRNVARTEIENLEAQIKELEK